MRRTVKPNVWNTICFPFDMTAAQLQDIFGGDVELAYLKIDKTNGCYEATYNDDGDVVAINVLFDRADLSEEGLDANYPYLIKTSKEVTEFEMTAAIAPEEVEAEINNGKSGKNKVVYGTFYGTYVAETLVPSHGLFISNNKFWYSTGNTKMKGYRGYFVLNEELASLAENAKIGFSVDGEATSIEGITQPRIVEGVYDLSGRKIQIEGNDLNKLQKGVYIIDGKKVTIK